MPDTPPEPSDHRKSEQFLFEVMMTGQSLLIAAGEGDSKSVIAWMEALRKQILHYREDVTRYMTAPDWNKGDDSNE